jgi:lipopolysaccharide transport system permease protein
VSQEIILEPGRADQNYWTDLWRYRELFQVLAWRNVAVRYKQTVIGIAWAVIRPLLTMAIFTVVFGRIAGLPSDGQAPYALMVLAGMLPWSFFASALSDSANSLVSEAQLVSKVYFPRLIVPGASVMAAAVDFAVSCAIIVAAMLWYRFPPTWHLLALPLFVAMLLLAAIGPGLWLTALNVTYRDFRHVLPFIVQLGLYVSPVGFSSNVIPREWRLLYSLNPMVGIIDGFRWCLLGGGAPVYWPALALSPIVIGLFLWRGIGRFRKMEKAFVDVI